LITSIGSSLMMKDCIFRDIHNPQVAPFIALSISPSAILPENLIHNVTFENIKVRYQLINFDDTILTVSNSTFRNITRIWDNNTPTNNDLEYIDIINGVAITAELDGDLIVSNSTFTDIGSHCIVANRARVRVFNSTFDNTNYESERKIPSAIDKYWGVSWIKIISSSLDVVDGFIHIIQGNTFLTNKIQSLSGGVRVIILVLNV